MGSSDKITFKDVIKSKKYFLHVISQDLCPTIQCAKEITAQVSARTKTDWVWMIQKYFKKQNLFKFCRAQ